MSRWAMGTILDANGLGEAPTIGTDDDLAFFHHCQPGHGASRRYARFSLFKTS